MNGRWRRWLAGAALVLGLPGAAWAQTQSCVPATTADWMVSSNQLAAPIRPADCAWVMQTPPDFGWPDLSSDAKYQVTLTYPGGRTKTVASNINWLNWPETLPSGDYSWTVQATNSGGTKTSVARRFTIDSSASTFLVPDAATLYSRATSKPHPRGLPDAATLSTMASQRSSGLKAVLSVADGNLRSKPASEPTSTSVSSNWSVSRDECKRSINAGLAYVFTKQSQYLADATARLKNLAAWNPDGKTSYAVAGMDMGAREIAWTMALLYDWLYPQLDAATRTAVQASLAKRMQVMVNDIVGSRSRVAIQPRDSHRAVTQTILSAMAVILAGDIPAAQTWVRDLVPQEANLASVWGGDDAGHANGTTQGSWDIGESMVPWYVLRWGVGVDIAQKAWMRNWSNFIAYFIPPGTPNGNFGDGAETVQRENWARFGKAATWFSPTPLGRWYASQVTGEDGSRMEVMLAPPADFTSASFPAGTSNAIVLRGIGWAAMHSDLSNPARTSVYFKSSPYGSFNHSHGDQNSFVINAGGKRLAIDTGYYDSYKSAHWLNWYKQTKAHNAITVDGGIGQNVFEVNGKIGRGKITRHVRGADHEIVYGDATHAYEGVLTKAQRAMVYLPPNLVLVYDDLASSTARQWEWNIHALNALTSSSGTNATIVNGDQKLCVDVLGGPTTGFRQTNAFSANPSGSWTAQWHGTFYSTTKLAATEFVTLLNVGCVPSTATPTPKATKTSGVWAVEVGGKKISIDAGNITVGAPVTAAPVPKSKPYSGTPVVVPATFEAENFDLGGEGLAYHDAAKGNAGGQYRTAEDVDIIATCDPEGGGFVVNNFNTGEWLAYTINVPVSGKYDIAAKVASNYATGAFHIEIDDKDVTGSIAPVNTGNWCTFKWFGKTGVPLTAGTHVLKVFADAQYFNFNSLRVTVSP